MRWAAWMMAWGTRWKPRVYLCQSVGAGVEDGCGSGKVWRVSPFRVSGRPSWVAMVSTRWVILGGAALAEQM